MWQLLACVVAASATGLDGQVGRRSFGAGAITERGVVVRTTDGEVAVEVGAAGVFRLGVSYQGDATSVIASPSLGPNRVMPDFTPVTHSDFTGIATT